MHVLADDRNDDEELEYLTAAFNKLAPLDEYSPESYSFLMDNISWKRFNHQVYGNITQEIDGQRYMWPLKNKDSLNKWRMDIGLDSIQLNKYIIKEY